MPGELVSAWSARMIATGKVKVSDRGADRAGNELQARH